MADNHQPFPRHVQVTAWARQKSRCVMCGTHLVTIGAAGQAGHRFGERTEGLHVIPHQMGGPATVENCVVLCRSCHLSAHQGGRWRDVSIYSDLAGLPMPEKIARLASEYSYCRG
jgi:hypothetical protein